MPVTSPARLLAALLLCLPCAAPAARAAAQAPAAWNGPRAMELIARARIRRDEPRADSLLRDYAAEAGGWVYFYLDRRDSEERTLVKTDQIALRLFWRAPDQTKQQIVGMRDESQLPNRMRYHLDHLTVVQNGFGDRIVVGDGDEVRDVVHPAAPGADSVYDYRLVDSLTIRLPGQEEVRAYEVQVRPKRADAHAIIGSVFVDRATADLVRMTFTFTPASYVDRRLDYINISLDNGLWQGRYWLPREQTVEIRRQIPELDFAAGAVIRGRLHVTGYEFNQDLPASVFYGYPVAAVPEREREAYAFEDELYADLNEHGLEPPDPFSTLREDAAELLGVSYLSGLPRLRLNIPDASSAVRYNRAEGVRLGAGATYALGPIFRADLTLGFAFGSRKPSVGLALDSRVGERARIGAAGYLNELRDTHVRPALSGVMNTLSAAVLGEDYLDPYLASGGRLGYTRTLGGPWESALGGRWEATLGASAEAHRSMRRVEDHALLDDSAAFRRVWPVTEGTLTAAHIRLDRPAPVASGLVWEAHGQVEVGQLHEHTFGRPTGEAALLYRTPSRAFDARLRLAGGAAFGREPLQRRFYLGGPNTLPGFRHRAFEGDLFALADVALARDVWAPWLRLRALAAAGATRWLPEDRPDTPLILVPEAPTHTAGWKASAGGGLGLFWDILRVDAWRPLERGGEWVILLSAHPDLHSIL